VTIGTTATNIITSAAGSMSSQAIFDWGFIARTSQLIH
jgi:hypothetical protein